ncbi:unnamed protein product [Auanema sp. JU1783]|nr:unnamed protein product [Auanema sp. JU1783]
MRQKIDVLLNTTDFSFPECLVSQWSSWGDCVGTCQYAEVVRNRDVVEPPLPETMAGGGMYRKVCPILYETKPCMPARCKKIENDMPRPNPLIIEEHSSAVIHLKLGNIGILSPFQLNINESNANHIPLQNDLENNEENFVRSTDDTVRNANSFSTAGDSLTPMKSPVESFVDEAVEGFSKKRSEKSHIQQPLPNSPTLRRIEVTSPPHTNPYISRLTFDMPLRKMLSPDIEKRLQRRLNISRIHFRDLGNSPTTTVVPEVGEPSVEQVLAELEAAGDMNIPWDDKHLRKAIRKNKKLMKALMDAYKFKKNLKKESDTQAPNGVENSLPVASPTSETTSFHENQSESTSSPTESTSVQYWKHQKGYVPNTRKHASDITNKLYMTKEIVQALSDDVIRRVPVLRIECLENSRCCRVERTECPDGTRPTMVRRFYRPPGASICVPYHYPKCSQTEEMEERPIEFEQNCQDLCFAGPEKRISPLLASDFHH